MHSFTFKFDFWVTFGQLAHFRRNWTNFSEVCFTCVLRGVWRSLVTILALSLTLLYFLGFFSTFGLFLTKLDLNSESVFWVDWRGLQVSGHDFGTFVDPTLILGILFDSWALSWRSRWDAAAAAYPSRFFLCRALPHPNARIFSDISPTILNLKSTQVVFRYFRLK